MIQKFYLVYVFLKQVAADTSKGSEEEVTNKRHRNTSNPEQTHVHPGSSKSPSEESDSMKALNKGEQNHVDMYQI